MNIEGYNFTVVATVLGMLVVFLSLTALSLLMVGLKASFGDSAGGKPRAGRGGRDSGRAAPGDGGLPGAGEGKPAERAAAGRPGAEEERQAPAWLTAAVAAYLMGSESEGPSADPWLPEFNHFDPWLAPGRSARSRSVGQVRP